METPIDPLFATLWAIWTAMFFVIEFIALRRPETGDTLSESFRYVFNVKNKYGKLTWSMFAVMFMVWFIPHIGWGYW